MVTIGRLDFCLLMIIVAMLCSEYLFAVKLIICLKFIVLVSDIERCIIGLGLFSISLF